MRFEFFVILDGMNGWTYHDNLFRELCRVFLEEVKICDMLTVERSGFDFLCASFAAKREQRGELVVGVHVILPPTALCHGTLSSRKRRNSIALFLSFRSI